MTTSETSVVRLSLIVVSRHRTQSLLRTITAIRQSDHPDMELIVVADREAADAVAALDLMLKLVRFDEPNISAARNAGLAAASAPLVAFIDDDAVPEPTWATRLSAVFADRRVVQAGGFVRGRNGLRWQWRGIEVDGLGQDHPLEVGEDVLLRQGSKAHSIKTQGTNCAFLAEALRAAGGFDPALRFYLDDADVNLRLAEHGLSAVVPGAVVHHGFAASAQRRADRIPTDLWQIGASLAVFLRRHAMPADLAPGLARLERAQRLRLLRHLVAGGLAPDALAPLMEGLAAGWREGLARPLSPLGPLPAPTGAFLPLPGTGPRPGVVLSGSARLRARLRLRAMAAVAQGCIVTAVCTGPALRRHGHSFDPAGFWWHEPGLARSLRHLLASARLNPYVNAEVARFAACRPLNDGFHERECAGIGTNSLLKR